MKKPSAPPEGPRRIAALADDSVLDTPEEPAFDNLATRVVFVSGDLTRESVRRFLAPVSNERMETPFSPSALRTIVRLFRGAPSEAAA